MSNEEETPENEAGAADSADSADSVEGPGAADGSAGYMEQATDEAASAVGVAEPPADEVATEEPEFPEMSTSRAASPANYELNRFSGVQVVLTAELGRAKLTIQDLMNLNDGAVVELDRAISSPVELVAQGVPLGNGEVVVIDDRFAIRIKEIYQS